MSWLTRGAKIFIIGLSTCSEVTNIKLTHSESCRAVNTPIALRVGGSRKDGIASRVNVCENVTAPHRRDSCCLTRLPMGELRQ